MKKAINLTPHAITLRVDSRDIVVPPSGSVARVAVKSTDRAPLELAEGYQTCEVPVVTNEYGAVENLPAEGDRNEYRVYLVSALVLGGCRGRCDVFAPDTGSTAVRGPNGQIQAVTRLISAE